MDASTKATVTPELNTVFPAVATVLIIEAFTSFVRANSSRNLLTIKSA